jgi:cation:H+ antiporter
MIMALATCLAALLILVLGAELVTRGGSTLAGQLGIRPILIGLTVVAVGTSAPELAVGIEAALQGAGALAIGNIAGTNTVNVLLILGLSAAIRPLALRMETLRMDLPVMVVSALAMLVMAFDGALTRTEGILLLLGGCGYTAVVVILARQESRMVKIRFAEEYNVPERIRSSRAGIARSTVTLLVGIAVIVVAADWLVDSAVTLARIWGVTDAFIGLTIVAIGTSAPEFVTTILSTLKKERDIAIGNLLGSSVYNILFILGATAAVTSADIPVTPELIRIDIPVMAGVAMVCVPVFLSGRQISRVEGTLFVIAYLLYLAFLLVTRT